MVCTWMAETTALESAFAVSDVFARTRRNTVDGRVIRLSSPLRMDSRFSRLLQCVFVSNYGNNSFCSPLFALECLCVRPALRLPPNCPPARLDASVPAPCGALPTLSCNAARAGEEPETYHVRQKHHGEAASGYRPRGASTTEAKSGTCMLYYTGAAPVGVARTARLVNWHHRWTPTVLKFVAYRAVGLV